MFTKTLLPGLCLAGVAALTLSGCGGGSPSAPTSSAPVSAPASAPASSAPAPGTPSASTAAFDDPCDVLDAATIKDLSGVSVKTGTTQDVGGSKVCSWLPEDGTDKDAAVFSGQEGPLPGTLDQVEAQLKTQFKGSVSPISVTGAQDARYVTGKASGLNIIDVLAQKDDVFYQVLVASPRDAAQHKAAAVKIAEALLKA